MKKILTIMLSVVIVASVAIGGTLAFLTAETSALDNVFTFDGIELGLTEYSEYSGPDGENIPYPTIPEVIEPGMTVDKIPVITVMENSVSSYVYVKVTNGFGDKAVIGIDTENWIAVEGSDGIYRYQEIVLKSDAAQALAPVFSTVYFDGETITMENIEELEDKTISVQAFAHQAGGNKADGNQLTAEDADQAAIDFFAAPAGE